MKLQPILENKQAVAMSYLKKVLLEAQQKLIELGFEATLDKIHDEGEGVISTIAIGLPKHELTGDVTFYVYSDLPPTEPLGFSCSWNLGEYSNFTPAEQEVNSIEELISTMRSRIPRSMLE